MADGGDTVVVTVCATVSTGLESVAVSECREKNFDLFQQLGAIDATCKQQYF